MAPSISREDLLETMSRELSLADDDVREAWERIRIDPEKWQCSPWGDETGGFWAVGIRGATVVWYNEIEDGFNASPFTTRGVIGQYECDQATFGQFLQSLPEAHAAESFAAGAATSALLPTLAGAGRITRRQTTYWEFEKPGVGRARVHFSGKREVRFEGADYESLVLTADHPVLEAHRQPWASVFVSGAEHCGAALSAELEERVRQATAGWRSAQEYLAKGGSGVLTAGFGLLLRAPEPIAEIAAGLVQAHGASASLLRNLSGAAGSVTSELKALLFGRSFIVAEAFRFMRLA